MIRYIDDQAIIDALEVGNGFVTVYINSTEPGLSGSYQQKFLREFYDLNIDPNLHNPERFHEPGDPRGSKWRTWENKFACHFHIEGQPLHILQQLLKRADLSNSLKHNIERNFK